jgi:HSP20 family protein
MIEKGLAIKRAEEPVFLKPFEFERLSDRMEEIFDSITRRAYEIFESNGRVFGLDLNNWLRAEGEILQPVHVDICESNDAFTIHAEVPGFNEKELEVKVEPRRLTITGKRETSKESKTAKSILSERRADQVLRVVCLPAEVDTDKVKATLKNGVLEIETAKAAQAKTVKIELKAA